MAKKLNMSAVKEYLFNHGEKVALGICAFVALALGGWGLLSAMSAGNDSTGKPWAKAFDVEVKRISVERNGAKAEELDPITAAKLDPNFYVWKDYESKFQPSPYVFFANDPGSKRLNPPALAINEKEIHVDYVRALAYVHEIEQGKQVRTLEGGAGGGMGGVPGGMAPPKPGVGGPPPVAGGMAAGNGLPLMLRKPEPVRMVVVTAVFPMKKQVEEFQRALKMLTQDDMFVKNRDDLPRPLGINVVRFELVKNEWKNPTTILMWDSNKLLMQEPKSPLDDLLKVAIYDDDLPKVLAPYLFEGLVTPLPRLGNAHYPRFNFPGMTIAWDELDKAEVAMGGGRGMGGGDLGGPPPMPKGSGGGPPPMPGIGGLPGIRDKNKIKDKDKDKGPDVPVDPIAAKKEGPPLKSAELKEKDPQLWDRLFGKPHKYNVYHILGQFQDKEKAATKDPRMPAAMGVSGGGTEGLYFSAWDIDPPVGGGVGPGMPPPGTGGPPPKVGSSGGPPPKMPMGMGTPPPRGDGTAPGTGAHSGTWERDAIVRFIDPGVVPGKTYKYAVQVRLANPNFNKNLEVVAGFMAQIRELQSEWRYTPQITIPGEYHLYALDQHLLDMWAKKQVKMDAKETKEFKLDKDQTTFQIHRWTDTRPNEMNIPLYIGDWAIAERVVVRRGEEIGAQALVQVPYWQKTKDIFEMPTYTDKPMGAKAKPTPPKQGLRMDFDDSTRPYLVDFTGGKRAKVGTSTVEEETALEAIILLPNGKLKVLNSRADADHTQEIEERDGTHVTRQERVEAARRSVRNVVNGGAPTAPPNAPKDPTTLPGDKKKSQ